MLTSIASNPPCRQHTNLERLNSQSRHQIGRSYMLGPFEKTLAKGRIIWYETKKIEVGILCQILEERCIFRWLRWCLFD